MANLEQLKQLVDSLSSDNEKFFSNGNSAAGTRLRKGLQKVKSLAQELRNDVTAKKAEK